MSILDGPYVTEREPGVFVFVDPPKFSWKRGAETERDVKGSAGAVAHIEQPPPGSAESNPSRSVSAREPKGISG